MNAETPSEAIETPAPAPAVVPAEVDVMTLIYIKEKYSGKIRPLTLIKDKATADAVTSLVEAANLGDAIVIDVPCWPAMKLEDTI